METYSGDYEIRYVLAERMNEYDMNVFGERQLKPRPSYGIRFAIAMEFPRKFT